MKINEQVVGAVIFAIAFCFESARAESNDGGNRQVPTIRCLGGFNADIKPIFDKHNKMSW